MSYKEFRAMLLEDEEEPLTIDGVRFKTEREMEAFIKRLYKAWKEGN